MTNEEVNTAVARKLGWIEKKYDWGIKWARDADVQCADSMEDNAPDYCHSIAAAWGILTDHCDTWEIFCNGSTVDVTLSKGRDTAGHEADTAPMAICLAFLKLQDAP